MKVNEFKNLSNTLAKVVRSFELCFDKVSIEVASVSYADDEFHIKLQACIEDFGVGEFKLDHECDSTSELTSAFVGDLLEQIENQLDKALQAELKFKKYWDDGRVYSNEFSCVSSVSALKMLKEVVTSMFAKVTAID